jgi:hypothetical protein
MRVRTGGRLVHRSNRAPGRTLEEVPDLLRPGGDPGHRDFPGGTGEAAIVHYRLALRHWVGKGPWIGLSLPQWDASETQSGPFEFRRDLTETQYELFELQKDLSETPSERSEVQ